MCWIRTRYRVHRVGRGGLEERNRTYCSKQNRDTE